MSPLSREPADVRQLARLAAARAFGWMPFDASPLKSLGDAAQRLHFGGVVGLMFGVAVDPAWLDELSFGEFCARVAAAEPAVSAAKVTA